MTNWRAVGTGFAVELFCGFVGLLVLGVGQLVAGLVGGFVAGYMGGTTVRSGLWHGLLAGSLGGFLLAIPLGILVAVASIGIGLTSQFGGFIAGLGAMMLVLLVAVVLGANSAIGGAIGSFVTEKYATNRTDQPETLTHNENDRQPTVKSESNRAVSNHEQSASSPKLTDVVRNQR